MKAQPHNYPRVSEKRSVGGGAHGGAKVRSDLLKKAGAQPAKPGRGFQKEEKRQQQDGTKAPPSTGATIRGSLRRTWGARWTAVSELRDGNQEQEGRVGGCRETGLAFSRIEAERVLRRREISPVGMQRRMDRGSSDHEQVEWV